MLPVVGTNPVMPSMNVVLPAPFGPMRPTSLPSSTVKSTASTARNPPNVTVMAVVCRRSVMPSSPQPRLQVVGRFPIFEIASSR